MWGSRSNAASKSENTVDPPAAQQKRGNLSPSRNPIPLSFGDPVDDRLLANGALYVSDDGVGASPKAKRAKPPKQRAVLAVLVLEEFIKELIGLTLTHAADLDSAA